MRALLAAAGLTLATAGVVVGSTAPAAACSCVSFGDVGSLERSAVAFIGTALPAAAPQNDYPNATNPSGQLDPFADRTLRFRVERIFKGAVGPEQEIATPGQGPACGLGTEIGKRYLVFGASPLAEGGDFLVTPEPGQYVGHFCNGTREANLDERPEGFPAGTRPAGSLSSRHRAGEPLSAEGDDRTLAGVLVACALVAGVIAVLIVLVLVPWRKRG